MRGRRAARKVLRLAYAPPPVHHGVLTQFAPLFAALFPARWFQTTAAAARGRGRGKLSLLDWQKIGFFLHCLFLCWSVLPLNPASLKYKGFIWRVASLLHFFKNRACPSSPIFLKWDWMVPDDSWIGFFDPFNLFLTKLCSGGWSIVRRLVVGLMNLQTWSFEPKEVGFQCDGMSSVT